MKMEASSAAIGMSTLVRSDAGLAAQKGRCRMIWFSICLAIGSLATRRIDVLELAEQLP